MKKSGTLLVIDDNRNVLTALKILLKDVFDNVITLPSPNTLMRQLEEQRADVVLLDMNFSAGLNTGNEGLFYLREIKSRYPELPVVLFTAYADINLAVEGMKEGAADFVVKPWDNDKLIATLVNAVQRSKPSSKAGSSQTSETFWGVSAAMQELKMLVEKIAPTDASILITGENGIGKTLLAKEIHRLSAYRSKPLVTVDLGSVAESLFESELFGHVKGAFTDAKSDRVGKLEEANDTTLFLDEIGNLALPQQAKLLTAIQNRIITRVGSNKPLNVNFRLVCATNQPLDEKVIRGEFREDLFYRINTIHLEIPPLRRRTEDILPLAHLFLQKFADKYHKNGLVFTTAAQQKLLQHPWYGNVRELEHCVEQAVIMCNGNDVAGSDIRLQTLAKSKPASDITTLEEMEIDLIRKSIDKNHGNLSAVASELGITRQTLYNKMKKFEL